MSDAPVQATFETLLAPHRSALRGFVYRMVGHPNDAEDLVQDVMLKAFERFDSLADEGAFKTWLYQIATRTCIDHLRKQARWRPFSQRYLEDACQEDESLRMQVVEVVRDPESAYDAREHIAFCFTCVARSLEPATQAALVLREMLELPNREGARVLGVSESKFRHLLSEARRSMQATFEGLCSLVNKEGVCRQCASFREATAEGKKGATLPILPDDAGASWDARLQTTRASPFADGVARRLHERLFRMLKVRENTSLPGEVR